MLELAPDLLIEGLPEVLSVELEMPFLILVLRGIRRGELDERCEVDVLILLLDGFRPLPADGLDLRISEADALRQLDRELRLHGFR